MSIQERKEREKQEMRSLILSAAIKLFVDKGFSSVTIRNIASKIDYSPGTIYLYFKDKDDIFFELHNQGFSEFYKRQLSIQDIKDPRERLKTHGMTYVKFAFENPELYDLMFISRIPAKMIERLKHWEVGEKSHSLLKLNVKQCMEAGHFKNKDADVIAFSLWSYVHGISSLFVCGRLKGIPDEQLGPLIKDTLSLLDDVV